MSAVNEVQFKPGSDDLRAFDRFVADGGGLWEMRPLAHRLVIVAVGCFVLLVINEVMPRYAGPAALDLFWLPFAFLTGLILGVHGGYLLWLAAGKWGPSRRALLREQHDLYRDGVSVSIAPEGVSVYSTTFFRFHVWRAVRDIAQTGNHLFLRTGRYEGVIVPRTAFDSDQAFYDFVHLAVEYFDGADADPKRPRKVADRPGPGAITLPPSVTLKPH
jgi:YcxB-like protein